MKTLYLLRHSGTLSTSVSGRDIDRRLSPAGIRDAETVAKCIANSVPTPQIIFTSPATRARETAAAVTARLPMEETVIPEIYEAPTSTLFGIVRSIDKDINTALIVGHNPGIASLVEFLTGEAASMRAPAAAKIEFDIKDWKDAERYSGRLLEIFSPAAEF
jgi:phosphohistidine phosphatase